MPHILLPGTQFPKGNENLQNDENADQIWKLYNEEASKVDQALVEDWKGSMDSILIFAGLYSAVVTAFIIESYKTLRQDSGDMTVILLGQVVSQLQGTGSQISNDIGAASSHFTPATQDVSVNIFWILSLVFSLASALMATMAQQWARYYIQATRRSSNPRQAARMRAQLFAGIERFGAQSVVESIPTLIHISLLLFFVGLAQFLWYIDRTVFIIITMVIIIFYILYFGITISPIIWLDVPFQTPISSLLWRFLRGLNIAFVRNGTSRQRADSQLINTQEAIASVDSPAQTQIQQTALRWTMTRLNTDQSVEALARSIPAFVKSEGASSVIQSVVKNTEPKDDPLGSKFVDLLRTCLGAKVLSDAQRAYRIHVCFEAIGALSSTYANSRPGRPLWLRMFYPSCTDVISLFMTHPGSGFKAACLLGLIQAAAVFDLSLLMQVPLDYADYVRREKTSGVQNPPNSKRRSRAVLPCHRSDGKRANSTELGHPMAHECFDPSYSFAAYDEEKLKAETRHTAGLLAHANAFLSVNLRSSTGHTHDFSSLLRKVPDTTQNIDRSTIYELIEGYAIQARYVILISLMRALLRGRWKCDPQPGLAAMVEIMTFWRRDKSGEYDQGDMARACVEDSVALSFVDICDTCDTCIIDQLDGHQILSQEMTLRMVKLLTNFHQPPIEDAIILMLKKYIERRIEGELYAFILKTYEKIDRRPRRKERLY